MATPKRIIGVLLPALLLIHTHETLPLNRAIGMCASFAGKSLIFATIIGIVSLNLLIKKEETKEDTKAGTKKVSYEQLAKIILGGMGTTAAFDYFAHTKNEEGVIIENDLPEVIEVSRAPADKQLSAEVVGKEVRELAGTASAVVTLGTVGTAIVTWPFKHWPFKRSNKSQTTTSANPSEQPTTIPLQVSVDPTFRTQLTEFRTQLENLAASHNGANISEEERQELINAFEQKLNHWFTEKQRFLGYLEDLYKRLLEGEGTIPENQNLPDQFQKIMTLIGQDVNNILDNHGKEFENKINTLVAQNLQREEDAVKAIIKQHDTQNKTARETDQQRYIELTNKISELERFKREIEATQQTQLQIQPRNCGWLASLNPFKGSDDFKGMDDSDQSESNL